MHPNNKNKRVLTMKVNGSRKVEKENMPVAEKNQNMGVLTTKNFPYNSNRDATKNLRVILQRCQ